MSSWFTPELIDVLINVLKAVVILLVVVTCGAFMSFGERRLLGLFQNRYGPNRVGWGGSLQLVADMIKMFFKEDWTPKFADRFIFTRHRWWHSPRCCWPLRLYRSARTGWWRISISGSCSS